MVTKKRTLSINSLLASEAYKACSSSGADMGRNNIYGGWYEYQFRYGGSGCNQDEPDYTETRLHLQRVTFDSGGYDKGGAYWGTPHDLWCGFTKDEQTMVFVRADNREEARADVEDCLLHVLGQDVANKFEFYV